MEGKVGLRKIKQWYRWLQAEKWVKTIQKSLEEKEKSSHLERKYSFFLCYTKANRFPTKEQREQALIEGWRVEVLPFKWYKVLLKGIPTLNLFFSKMEETLTGGENIKEKGKKFQFGKGGFWLITNWEGPNVIKKAAPSFLEEEKESIEQTWTFWANRVWTYEQFKNHPSWGYPSREVAINQIISQTIVSQIALVQSQQQPMGVLLNTLEQYVEIKKAN